MTLRINHNQQHSLTCIRVLFQEILLEERSWILERSCWDEYGKTILYNEYGWGYSSSSRRSCGQRVSTGLTTNRRGYRGGGRVVENPPFGRVKSIFWPPFFWRPTLKFTVDFKFWPTLSFSDWYDAFQF